MGVQMCTECFDGNEPNSTSGRPDASTAAAGNDAQEDTLATADSITMTAVVGEPVAAQQRNDPSSVTAASLPSSATLRTAVVALGPLHHHHHQQQQQPHNPLSAGHGISRRTSTASTSSSTFSARGDLRRTTFTSTLSSSINPHSLPTTTSARGKRSTNQSRHLSLAFDAPLMAMAEATSGAETDSGGTTRNVVGTTAAAVTRTTGGGSRRKPPRHHVPPGPDDTASSLSACVALPPLVAAVTNVPSSRGDAAMATSPRRRSCATTTQSDPQQPIPEEDVATKVDSDADDGGGQFLWVGADRTNRSLLSDGGFAWASSAGSGWTVDDEGENTTSPHWEGDEGVNTRDWQLPTFQASIGVRR